MTQKICGTGPCSSGRLGDRMVRILHAVVHICLGSFDCPPRNPVEKISSGYKAWEFLIYVFGYCSALLHGILPQQYWQNFCKLVSAVCLLQQHLVSVSQLQSTHLLVLEFTEEYKAIYYRSMVSCLHFCQQSIHGLSHLAPDIARLVLCLDWTSA